MSGYRNITFSFDCNVEVFVSYWYPPQATCYQYYIFAAATSQAVNTTLDIYMNWYGDLGGFMSGYFQITNGNSCNSTSVFSGGGVNCLGEYVSTTQYAFNCNACTCCPSVYNGYTYGDPGTIPTGGSVTYGSSYPC